jgi:hypothetical protein
MSEHYALYVFPQQNADDQLASEIAALSGCEAVVAKVALEEGGTLGNVFSQSKAQHLSHALGLLGVMVELRATLPLGQPLLYKPTSPEPLASHYKSIPQGVQFVSSRKRRHPLVFGLISFVLCLAILGWSPWRSKASPLPGMLAPAEPVQGEIKEKPWQHGDYLITPLASYEVTARVLSKKDYTWDKSADISPVDLALGWGVMSDSKVLEDLRISQSGRWFYVYWQQASVDTTQVMTHSANTHILPATAEITRKVKGAKRDDIVRLKGYLVEVTKSDGFLWRSSLVRGDTGDGSCEILWVTDAEIVPPMLLQARR